jgi:hypothetical protein
MTQDEIMKMARKAGFADSNGVIHAAYQLESFAALVASAEREACAKVCDDLDKMRGYSYADKCATAIRARGQA